MCSTTVSIHTLWSSLYLHNVLVHLFIKSSSPPFSFILFYFFASQNNPHAQPPYINLTCQFQRLGPNLHKKRPAVAPQSWPPTTYSSKVCHIMSKLFPLRPGNWRRNEDERIRVATQSTESLNSQNADNYPFRLSSFFLFFFLKQSYSTARSGKEMLLQTCV